MFSGAVQPAFAIIFTKAITVRPKLLGQNTPNFHLKACKKSIFKWKLRLW